MKDLRTVGQSENNEVPLLLFIDVTQIYIVNKSFFLHKASLTSVPTILLRLSLSWVDSMWSEDVIMISK